MEQNEHKWRRQRHHGLKSVGQRHGIVHLRLMPHFRVYPRLNKRLGRLDLVQLHEGSS